MSPMTVLGYYQIITALHSTRYVLNYTNVDDYRNIKDF